MLMQILRARRMLKRSIRELKSLRLEHREDELKNLHNRQLGLKLLANVTYGYAAANYSGRMPMVEVADAVLSLGRYHLQRAISMLTNFENMGTRVVYGDTDSVFVSFPKNISRRECFTLCDRMAASVTRQCPFPMRLMFEKIYDPCILIEKKHYAGLAFETKNSTEGILEIKGLEAIRRDGCALQSTVVHHLIDLMFHQPRETVSDWPNCEVANYLRRVFADIRSKRVNPVELVIAKEFQGRHRYRMDPNLVPSLRVVNRRFQSRWTSVNVGIDIEPKLGERVPYIITTAVQGTLADRAREPRELLTECSYSKLFLRPLNSGPFDQPDVQYYLHKQIVPPVDRILATFGQSSRPLLIASSSVIRQVQIRNRRKSRIVNLKQLKRNLAACMECTQSDLSVAMDCQNYECPLLYTKYHLIGEVYVPTVNSILL